MSCGYTGRSCCGCITGWNRPDAPVTGGWQRRTQLPLRERRRPVAYPESPCGRNHRAFLSGGYVGVVKIRQREPADQAAAQAFLARHNSLRAARLGELVHPLDHPALVAEAADGHLLGIFTYVPSHDGDSARSSLSTPMSSGVVRAPR